MIRRALLPILLLPLLLLFVFSAPYAARAQDCQPNMLSIGDTGSYVATADAPALHMPGAFTVECWAKLNSFRRFAAIFDKGSGVSQYGLFVDTGERVFVKASAKGSIRLESDVVPDFTAWHHYALVFIPRDGFYLYVDTTLSGYARSGASSVDSTLDSLRIGASAGGLSFIGGIDEFRLWNYARPLSAIRTDMYHALRGTEAGLSLYYSFDDETGVTKVHDFSGHGIDGRVLGASAEIVGSSSPVTGASPGFRLAIKENRLVIPTRSCVPSFDTIIHVHNVGTTPLYVSQLSFYSGVAFSISLSTSVPFYLPADSSKYYALKIHFSPPRGGVFDDTLYLSSTDVCAGVQRLGLHASYDSVGLSVSPNTIDFGDVTPCELPATRLVTVRNMSASDSVTVVGANLLQGSGVTVLTPLPLTLGPNESKQVAIALAAGASGPVTASLVLNLDKCSRQALLSVDARRDLVRLALPPVIDFGTAASQIGGVTRDTLLILTNSGDVGTTISAIALSPDSSLQLLEPRVNRYVAPRDTTHLRLRVHLNACGVFTGSLKVQSAVCRIDTTVLVAMNVTAPAPLVASGLDAGVTCSFVDTSLAIYNPNSDAVELDTITFSRNAVFFTPPDTFPFRIEGHAMVRVPVRFAPGTNGDYDVTALLHSSPCGLATVDLKGSQGVNGVGFGSSVAYFGRGCDLGPVVRTLTLRNNSTRTVTIADTLLRGSRQYVMLPLVLPLTLQPGATRDVQFRYQPRMGVRDTAHLTLFTREGCVASDLRLSGSREIAKLQPTAPAVGFDTVCPGTTRDLTVGLRNIGIDTVDIHSAFFSLPEFSIVQMPASIAPDSTGTFTIRFAPRSQLESADDLSIVVDSCGTSLTLPVHGSGGAAPMILTSNEAAFGSVHVGDSAILCVTFSNPSCTALTIDASSIALDGTPFHLTSASRALLPITIARDNASELCFVYTPSDASVSDTTVNLLSASIAYGALHFSGAGLAPDIKLDPSSLDFGYVLLGAQKKLPVEIANIGNYPAAIAIRVLGTSDFTADTLTSVSPGFVRIDSIAFAPTALGTEHALLEIAWDGNRDTVMLTGVGTEKGMLLSASAMGFGDVHVNSDSSLVLYVTATNDLPSNVRYSLPTNAPFLITANKSLPYTIRSEQDTLALTVRYHPTLEQPDTATLLMLSDTRTLAVTLGGRGVEAHPQLNAVSIDIGDVVLGQTLSLDAIKLRNTGFYPLTVLSHTNAAHFDVTLNGPSHSILPPDSLVYTVTFSPTRARTYRDTVYILTSSPDPAPFVVLTGTGVYPMQERPAIGYTVASSSVKAGDHVTIPVSITGTNIQKLDIDSVSLKLRYDPTMVHFAGLAGLGTFRFVDDSTIAVSIAWTSTGVSTLFGLEAEALLGAHETTYVRVTEASPKPTLTPSATDGAFVVTDCGGSLHGVDLSGGYRVSAIVPNPVTDRALLRYDLGRTGAVTVDLFNALGAVARHYDLPEALAGVHELTIDLSAVPNGRYVYKLKSGAFTGEGTLIVLH